MVHTADKKEAGWPCLWLLINLHSRLEELKLHVEHIGSTKILCRRCIPADLAASYQLPTLEPVNLCRSWPSRAC